MIKQIAQTTCYKFAIFILRVCLIYLLAHIFTPEDFGAYTVITTVYTFLMLITGLSMSSYISRVVPGQELTQQIQIFKTTFLFEVGATAILVFLFMCSGLIEPTLTVIKISHYQKSFFVGLLLLIAILGLTEVNGYLWAKLKILHSNRTDFIGQALWILPLIFLWYKNISITVTDVLLANLIGVLFGILYGFLQIEIKLWWQTKFNITTLQQAISYSAPLIIPAISLTALRSGDRLILAHYQSLHDVGVYSFAFNFLNTLYTFSALVIFSNLMPYIVRAHNLNNLKQRNIFLLNAFRAAMGTFLAGAFILIFFSKPLIDFIARPEYLDACNVLLLLTIGTLNIILAYPGHIILSLQNRVFLLMWIDLFCLIFGMILSFILIPRYSYHGAAWTMTITFGLGAVIKTFYARLWNEISFNDFFLLWSVKVEGTTISPQSAKFNFTSER